MRSFGGPQKNATERTGRAFLIHLFDSLTQESRGVNLSMVQSLSMTLS